MNDVEISEFRQFLDKGIIRGLNPTLTMSDAWKYFQSLEEKVDLWSRGDEWVFYGMISIGTSDHGEFNKRTIDRVGINFSRLRPGEYFSSIAWISQIMKMKRSELYRLLSSLGIGFFERVKYYEDGQRINEEIQIGNPPRIIINFDLDNEQVYQIYWFKTGFQEDDYPYYIELISM